ncbi:hypothetical protein PHMEG_0008728 [Phytophthora megakarya]|uniref:Uncharacterized protein n=1 Tax=Phytophthora megakarya TaxID=4795 RepID=A0A225WI18_9STRA|nr:hypothetical protein PHMEG_0008728 [Phytophthora megakarya]
MFDRHTSQNIFALISKFLGALYSNWRAKLIGMASDGENTMTAHQIDIVVKSSAKGIEDGHWINFLNAFSVFLRSQDNLIISMNVKCPKKTNRWVHLGRLLTFYKAHYRKLITYTREKRPEMLPSDEWWVVTFSVSPVIDTINVTLALLQKRSLRIAQQEDHIHALIEALTSMFHIEIEQSDDTGAQYVAFHSMRVHINDIIAHIEDQGSLARASYERLDEAAKKAVVRQITVYAMILVDGLDGVKAERDGANRGLEQNAPPVLPSQLVRLRHGVFLQDVLDPYREHISKHWKIDNIDGIEADHRDLLKAYNAEETQREIIDKYTVATDFNEAWDCVSNRFHQLQSFCGGLATVFANTTSVESDFSILKWEMDDNRTNMMHLSLEGIFQAKRRAKLQSLML